MAYEWFKTKFLGVRYRFHKSRKHGVNFDRCFSIRYKIDGKDKEEVTGWASEGMTAEKAYKILSEIRNNIRSGNPQNSYANIRKHNEEIRQNEERQKNLDKNNTITVNEFWQQSYFPQASASKTNATIRNERSIFEKWLQPHIGELALSSLRPSHVEDLLLTAAEHGKSPQTARHIVALLSQMWNMAYTHEIVNGENPCKRVKKPQQDSRRVRFLTTEEAKNLLDLLKKRSKDTYDAAVISLFAGLRAGEIHSLRWSDIDLNNDTIYIRDPKNKYSRHAFISNEIRKVFESRIDDYNHDDFVFKSINGKKRLSISDTFERVVAEMELNKDIHDRRQRVVFHTLRHTFASWLVQKGTPLYTVAELMGHTSLEMTRRYAHLAPDTMRLAANSLSGVLCNE